MQRKNYFLKTSFKAKKMRNAMAMMMAIIVLVVIATVMSLSLALTIQTSKRTTDIYLYEQSVLLSQSAADYAMLRISQQAPCTLGSIPFGYGGDGIPANDIYDITITMKYISVAGTNCDNNLLVTPALRYGTTTFIGDPSATKMITSDGTVIMDITVTASPAGTTEPIRYFRRSVQKM